MHRRGPEQRRRTSTYGEGLWERLAGRRVCRSHPGDLYSEGEIPGGTPPRVRARLASAGRSPTPLLGDGRTPVGSAKQFRPVVDGGVTFAAGFTAGAVYAGIKTPGPDKLDLAILASDRPAAVAGIFTRNALLRGAGGRLARDRGRQAREGGDRQRRERERLHRRAGAGRRPRDGARWRPRRSTADPAEVLVASTGMIGINAADGPDPGRRPRRRVRGRRRGAVRAGDHHDRHPPEVGRRRAGAGRQDGPDRRIGEGRRHDPPEHGDAAGVRDDGRGGRSRVPPDGAGPGRRRLVQHDHRRRRHQHQRHAGGAGERRGRQSGRRAAARTARRSRRR